jgi:CRP-like cAMP-binding protein
VFELIAPNDRAIRFLLERLLERCRNEFGTQYVEIDVSAHAPRMQRTLVELGFLPVAYLPAMVFHRVERLDVIKMARLLIPPRLGEMQLTPGMGQIAEVVMRSFRRQAVLPEVADALHHLHILRGLSREQSLRVASACAVSRFADGEVLFHEGDEAEDVFVLLAGEVGVTHGPRQRTVGRVGVGESLGEIALLMDRPHSATATARGAVTVAHVSREGFAALARQRPDIGTILFRNLALGLGHKLQRMDKEVAAERPDWLLP